MQLAVVYADRSCDSAFAEYLGDLPCVRTYLSGRTARADLVDNVSGNYTFFGRHNIFIIRDETSPKTSTLLMSKSTTMSKKLYAALFLVFSAAIVSGCGGMTTSSSSGSGNDINFRVSQLEQRLNNIDTSGSASSWNDQEAMRNDISVLRNQMNDLNNRLDGGGRGGDLSAEVAVLKQRVDRLEGAMAQLQSQLGLDLEAMKTPIAPPASLGSGAAGAGLTTTPPPVTTPQPPIVTPQPPVSSAAGIPQTGAAGTVPPVTSGLSSGSTETVVINGVPQQLAVNPNAAAVQQVDANAAAAAAANAPVQYGAAEGSSDPATALYNSGTAAFNARRYSDALKIFTDFTTNYPKHELASNAWFWQGETNYQTQNYGNAALSYQEVITKFPKSSKMAASMLKQGMSFEKLGKRDAANARYKDLISKYPNSPEAKRAKTLIR